MYADYASFLEKEILSTLIVSENVKLVQEGKLLTADFAKYIQEQELFEMRGSVVIELDNLDWLLDNQTVQDIENKDIQSSLNDKTTISANLLVFNGFKKETKLIGNIKIVQSDKTIFCDKLILYDETAIVECIGNVKVIKENQDTMTTQLLTIDLNKEIFTAKKGVYSEYHLQNKN